MSLGITTEDYIPHTLAIISYLKNSTSEYLKMPSFTRTGVSDSLVVFEMKTILSFVFALQPVVVVDVDSMVGIKWS